MLKKLGLVTVGVTAGLMAAAPLASAESHVDENNNVTTETNNIGVDAGNVIGQGNGQGNTFNGVEVPGFPDAPELPPLPSVGDLLPEVPSQFELPSVPA
ncbi:hypothetical protein [Actinomycetospora cinnamomea]|uniref:Secreted protein n=1 Tax=Actinomycetospora cinnamomea TaxID=663609 RepID=A0A2U1F6F7_9PSEU|nr:hypothetical protein [Actinomycetospora cinnamomea]PVZ07763.1 hypothetical protein C8D89_111134 [Actinomycetospora cinnamomea]